MITVNKKMLLALLKVAGMADSPKVNVVKLEVSFSKLTALCFDGSQCFSGSIPVMSSEEWVAFLERKTLSELLGTIATETVNLSKTETNVHLEAGQAKMKLRLMEADLPGLPIIESPHVVSLTAKDMIGMAKVAPFASNEDARAILKAVHVKAGNTGIMAEAANGFTMARTQVSKISTASWEALFPAPYLADVSAVLTGTSEGTLELMVGPNHVVANFHGEGVEYAFATTLMDGKFPDVDQIIPKTAKAEVTLANAGDIKTFADRANAFGKEATGILLHMKPAQNRIRAYAKAVEGKNVTGTTLDELQVARATGQEVKVVLARKFVAMAADFLGTPTIKVVGPVSPVVFSNEDNLVVVMPLTGDIEIDLYAEEGIGIPVELPAQKEAAQVVA